MWLGQVRLVLFSIEQSGRQSQEPTTNYSVDSDRLSVYGKEAEQENEFLPEGKAGGWNLKATDVCF